MDKYSPDWATNRSLGNLPLYLHQIKIMTKISPMISMSEKVSILLITDI
jgi:hypothetical protein